MPFNPPNEYNIKNIINSWKVPEKVKRFDLNNFTYRENGTGNIGDFKSSAAHFRKIGFVKYHTVTLKYLTESGDRRGWFYEISDTLRGMKANGYRFGGWAETSVFGNPAITFYVKKESQ